MKYKSDHLASCVLSIAALLAFFCPSARATYIATLNEIGSDVVGTGSGSLDQTDLAFIGAGAGTSGIQASIATFALGPTFTGFEFWKGISGPTSFGSGGGFIASDSGSGNYAGVFGAAAGGGNLFVPVGNVPGAPLGVSTATWNNQTFATLGVTPGTYIWTWGSGMHADSFTLQIGPVGPTNGVPETGSTIALMLGAIGTLIAFRSKLAARS